MPERMPRESHTVAWLRKNGFAMTRRNILDLWYLGNPPAELGPEEEFELNAVLNAERRRKRQSKSL
jgi:hypothetical protein